jgi:predicted nucleotidyltransferase
MNFFLEKHLDLLREMIHADVEFLIIGGYAVNFHGYNRMTVDLDIWIRPDNKTRDILIRVLSGMKFEAEGLDRLKEADFSKVFVFNIWEKPFKVDFLTQIQGCTFPESYINRVNIEIEGVLVPFISFLDLVASKMVTSRLRDKADVEELQKVRHLRENKSR